MSEYQLLDSGEHQKLERFGSVTLVRPCSQAIWSKSLDLKVWENSDAEFKRSPKGEWNTKTKLPQNWICNLKGLKFHLEKTSFGHVGLFPEHSQLWSKMKPFIENYSKDSFSLLNLFAYTGAASLFAAKCGAKVCHVDASKGMVDRARENAELNQLKKAPIRWIVDDVFKFLKREIKRGHQYQGVLLDPPSFGRGTKGEVFKIEAQLKELLHQVKSVLSEDAKFVCMTCHTPGLTPIGLKNILRQVFDGGEIEVGELCLNAQTHELPGGIYGFWHR